MLNRVSLARRSHAEVVDDDVFEHVRETAFVDPRNPIVAIPVPDLPRIEKSKAIMVATMDECILKDEWLSRVLAKAPVFRVARSNNPPIDVLLKFDDEPLCPSWCLNHDIVCNLEHILTSIVIGSLEEVVPDMCRSMMAILHNHFGSRHSVLVGNEECIVAVNPNVEAVLYGWALGSLKRGKQRSRQITFLVRTP
jgi:hypothetical protein